jgi:hypothetical protein
MVQIAAVGSVSETWHSGRVLRLNMTSEANRRFADRVGVVTTPTFILFDAKGCEQGRWVNAVPRPEDLDWALATQPGDETTCPVAAVENLAFFVGVATTTSETAGSP